MFFFYFVDRSVAILSHALCRWKTIHPLRRLRCMHTVAFDGFLLHPIGRSDCCRLCNFFYRRFFSCARHDTICTIYVVYAFFLFAFRFCSLSLSVILLFLLSFIDEQEPHDRNATTISHSRRCRRLCISPATHERIKKRNSEADEIERQKNAPRNRTTRNPQKKTQNRMQWVAKIVAQQKPNDSRETFYEKASIAFFDKEFCEGARSLR